MVVLRRVHQKVEALRELHLVEFVEILIEFRDRDAVRVQERNPQRLRVIAVAVKEIRNPENCAFQIRNRIHIRIAHGHQKLSESCAAKTVEAQARPIHHRLLPKMRPREFQIAHQHFHVLAVVAGELAWRREGHGHHVAVARQILVGQLCGKRPQGAQKQGEFSGRRRRVPNRQQWAIQQPLPRFVGDASEPRVHECAARGAPGNSLCFRLRRVHHVAVGHSGGARGRCRVPQVHCDHAAAIARIHLTVVILL